MVANRYADGRVFLCGDAAHIWIPMGGFGMNAGVEDAVNLSWKLAATLAGWATPQILDSYAAERRSIGQLVADSAAKIFADLYRIPVQDPLYEADGAAADQHRAEIGRAITAHNVAEFDSIGMQLGVTYTESPIICYDGASAPPFAIDRYIESSRPGVRAPHLWRRSGKALFDDFGLGYTLLRIGAGAPAGFTISDAFAARGVPLKVLAIDEPEALRKYDGYPLVLIRPDQHVAWRSHHLPANANPLIDVLTAA